MNALKHMEAVFLITLSAAGIGSYLAATSQDAYALPAPRAVTPVTAVTAVPAQATATAAPRTAVVTVVGKRLSAAEKAQSLRDEQAADAGR